MYSASSCAAICSAVSPHCASHCWLSSRCPAAVPAPASPASPPAPPVASHPCFLQHLRRAPVPRLRLFTILCFDSQERREAPGWYTVWILVWCRSVPWSACHRPTRTGSPPVYATATSTRQVTLPPPHPFSRPAAQRVIEVAALHLRLTVLYPRVEHQTVLAVVVVVVGPLVVHPYHPFRDAVRLLRQPAVFIVAVDIVRIFRDAVIRPRREVLSGCSSGSGSRFPAGSVAYGISISGFAAVVWTPVSLPVPL